MQFRIIPGVIVFFGSYLPLSLILLAQNFQYDALSLPLCAKFWRANCFLPFQNPAPSVGIFLFTLVCFVLTLLLLRSLRPKHEIIIRSATHVPADLMNYTLPYVVSFMSIDYQDIGKFVGLGIFLVWMFWITYRSGQIILNPVLIVFGWRPYDIEYGFPTSASNHHGLALVHGEVAPNERHRYFAVQDILIVKPANQE